IGRDELVIDVVREIRKGKHTLLTGPTGIGKSRVLEAAIKRIERRQDELIQAGLDLTNPIIPPTNVIERRIERRLCLAYLKDHQAKGQFVELSRRLLEARIVKPSALGLPKRMDSAPIDWAECKRTVNRQGIRDITGAILPAIHAYKENGSHLIIAVDDMTFLTPTQSAFWLAVFDQAQLVGCASGKKDSNRKLWWRMKEIEVPALTPEAATHIVRTYIARKGILIESPELYISHVVKQAQGNPQAIADMLDDSAKERVVDKRRIREMKHAAGVRYLDFTPVMIVSGACIIGARYVAIGLGDTTLYVMAGMAAALFLSLRFFMFRGAGRAN
ncbi:MAG: ATP-binding protein, partial [Beggiatoa sp.]|nr:ATP-binding protein [Beggiatoa sp.]